MIINGLDDEVRTMLREDLPAQRDAVIKAMNAEEWQQARDIVHAVNGSASFCRLRELQSAAAVLERQLDAGRADVSSQLAFTDAINHTLSALN